MGAYSSGQLLQVDFLKTKLGGNFDYNQCLDDNKYLDPQKLVAYAAKYDIDLNKISVDHNYNWLTKKSKK